MRFLHTADWHLGQTLLGRSRLDEQARALDWLYEACVDQQADGLIVAGDIFDVSSPAEDARRMYYNFLGRLSQSSLKWIVVVAGNHDSPRMLGSTRELAQHLGIHIVAAPPEDDDGSDIIELRDPSTNKLQAVVAAVPFLHAGYVRRSTAGQSFADQGLALTHGIHAHYERLAQGCHQHVGNVPVLATGHLYASGANAREGQDNIYVGNVRNLNAVDLPKAFDYVALGHIHRPQALSGAEHVRYSGSLIPLDFAESSDEKGIWRVDFTNATPDVVWLASPVSRRLKQFTGTYKDLLERIAEFGERHNSDDLQPWAALQVVGGGTDERSRAALRKAAKTAGVDILKITRQREADGDKTDEPIVMERLEELDEAEVYKRKCDSAELSPEQRTRIDPLFARALAGARAGKLNLAE